MTSADESLADGEENADDLERREREIFRDLIRRLREKCPDAQTEFVNTYWNAFKRRVRVFFTDAWMRRHFDESDVVLSLMQRALDTLSVNDGHQINTPEQLVNFCLAHAGQRYVEKVRSVLGRRIHTVSVKFEGQVSVGDEFSLAIGERTQSYTATTPIVTDVVDGLVALCQQPDQPREFARIKWAADGNAIVAKGPPGARFSIRAETTSATCCISTINPSYLLPARGDLGCDTAQADEDPTFELGQREFLSRVRELLSRDQRYVFDLRTDEAQGADWRRICELIGEAPEKWRQVSRRFRTAVTEALAQMGFTDDLQWLDDDDEED